MGLAVSAALWALPALAQSDAEKEIERYRAMISDPMSNPGFLNVDRGEVLWKTKRGTKNVSLEKCDLGEGPGKFEFLSGDFRVIWIKSDAGLYPRLFFISYRGNVQFERAHKVPFPLCLQGASK